MRAARLVLCVIARGALQIKLFRAGLSRVLTAAGIFRGTLCEHFILAEGALVAVSVSAPVRWIYLSHF